MEDLAKLSRKEREKLLRRQDILSAAAKLFAEKGFSNTTLEDIAVKAEFGIGTIYNYFQNKEEIFRSIIDSVLQADLEITMAVDQDTVTLVEFVRQYTVKFFEYFIENKDAFLLLVSLFTGSGEKPVHLKREFFESKHCQVDDKVKSRIRQGIENREIRELNVENLFYFFHSLIFTYVTHLLKVNKLTKENVNEHSDFVLDVLFNGVLIK